MGKRWTLLLGIALLGLLSSCGAPKASGGGLSPSDESMIPPSSGSDPRGQESENLTTLEAILPQEFEYNGRLYECNFDLHCDENKNISSFFGYFVNLEDLEQWKQFDNSDDIVYVTDPHNGIYRLDLSETGYLRNRFPLYLTFEKGQIALAGIAEYLIYEIQEEELYFDKQDAYSAFDQYLLEGGMAGCTYTKIRRRNIAISPKCSIR